MPEPRSSTGTAFGEQGVSGLSHSGGSITEEWDTDLRGLKAINVYRQMGDGDPAAGGALYAIDMALREVNWTVEPASDDPEAIAQAEFVEQCRHDMSLTWGDFVSEALSKVQYGWSYFESVYKRREGPDGEAVSKHNDGLIGWRKFGLRAQETLVRWEIDDDGGIRGMWQRPGTSKPPVFIPIEKSMLFRTSVRKNNPEGFSLLRRAYTSWYRKDRVETAELIAVERDLVGVPMFEVPEEMMAISASDGEKAAIAEYKKIVTQLRRGDQAGLVIPDWRDDEGRKIGGFKLVESPGTRLIPTGEIVERHTKWIVISMLQDILLLGHEGSGSLALAETKKALANNGMKALVDEVAETINRFEIPRLLRLNGMRTDMAPEIVAGEIADIDLEQMAKVIAATASAGMEWFGLGEQDTENKLRSVLGFEPVAFTDDDGTAFAPTRTPAAGTETQADDDPGI
jgi:hypothetical protein